MKEHMTLLAQHHMEARYPYPWPYPYPYPNP